MSVKKVELRLTLILYCEKMGKVLVHELLFSPLTFSNSRNKCMFGFYGIYVFQDVILVNELKPKVPVKIPSWCVLSFILVIPLIYLKGNLYLGCAAASCSLR